MAEVSRNVPPQLSRMSTTSYFPTIPRGVPKAAISYSQSVNEAPYTALMGVIVDGRYPERHAVTPRCRVRKQVGGTNRWRLPDSLGSDLLGSRQAIKSINMPYNSNMINIITAENPQSSLHLEADRPYVFHQVVDRPVTVSQVPSTASSKPGFGLLSRESTVLVRAPSRLRGPTPSTSGPIRKFIPANARPATPKDIFLYHSKKSQSFIGPDVVLKCLGMDWELHRPYLQKSEVLSQLLKQAGEPHMQKYYRNPASETLDTYIKKNNVYSNEYKDISNRLSMVEGDEEGPKKLDHPAHTSEKRISSVTMIKLDIKDPLITKTAMAVALGNLYHDELDVDLEDVANVLAASSQIGYKALQNGCARLMLNNISYKTVCRYHHACTKYQQEEVVKACERWLELNLLPELSNQIYLREISMELLQKILKSNRLYVPNEYTVYRTLSYWLFLQLNSSIQLMPSHSTVLSYFNSLPKTGSFLERDDGQIYGPLFSAVRLQGVTDTNQIRDMQLMNILPQSQLIDLLTQHYHALQGGGDMSALKHFNTGAIRQGFIIDEEPHYHSEVLSIHGFHFELKAARNAIGQLSIYMQRLKPGDPILSFRQCERHTFSIRTDREVRYCIMVQDSVDDLKTTGIVSQKFGLGEKVGKSEILQQDKIRTPLYISFSLLFPAS
ncbi:BTB/POZ domain-containing protein 16 [Mytilus galloprovincialis]|uniref:BTB/POZ domain-containing protein 16 n=1 Tax=Mytilus galloprovincialis TaxID=29158 RepID=A0A8B6BHL9_MYTGA|nr:BTB/POZ domain-containing protein 16 [Mytilus galloprovincialis]